ncbi:MAG: hypothetical protein GXO18_00200 [Aquificae bacterium]|nr:hypothetical protein [Aquificota bacterium]
MKVLALLLVSFILFGCGGGNDNSDIQSKVGYFIDPPVENLEYITSSNLRGKTGPNGEFEFLPGDTVVFKIGNLILGDVVMREGKYIVTPVDLVENSSGILDVRVSTITALLQVLNTSQSIGKISLPDFKFNSNINIEKDLNNNNLDTYIQQIKNELARIIETNVDNLFDPQAFGEYILNIRNSIYYSLNGDILSVYYEYDGTPIYEVGDVLPLELLVQIPFFNRFIANFDGTLYKGDVTQQTLNLPSGEQVTFLNFNSIDSLGIGRYGDFFILALNKDVDNSGKLLYKDIKIFTSPMYCKVNDTLGYFDNFYVGAGVVLNISDSQVFDNLYGLNLFIGKFQGVEEYLSHQIVAYDQQQLTSSLEEVFSGSDNECRSGIFSVKTVTGLEIEYINSGSSVIGTLNFNGSKAIFLTGDSINLNVTTDQNGNITRTNLASDVYNGFIIRISPNSGKDIYPVVAVWDTNGLNASIYFMDKNYSLETQASGGIQVLGFNSSNVFKQLTGKLSIENTQLDVVFTNVRFRDWTGYKNFLMGRSINATGDRFIFIMEGPWFIGG